MMLSLVLSLFVMQAEVKLATVEGTVVHAATKAGVRKARVTLSPVSSGEQPQSAEAGEDGKYQIKDVKPGRYRLSAEKTGFQMTAYGAKRPGEAMGQPITVVAGAALTGIDIGLPKHGVIAGKILDHEGEPVAKALVMAMNSVYYQGRKTRLPAGTVPVMSNDLGEYRIGQLPPGKYVVCSISESSYSPGVSSGELKSASFEGSLNTCFPNVPRMSEATDLEVVDGTELAGMDIRMLRGRNVTVKGRIDGIPAGANAVTILNLTPKGIGPMGRAMGPRAALQGAQAAFEFKAVPPGSYVLQTLPTGLGSTSYVVRYDLEVGDQAIDNLAVQALTTMEVPGQVIAEPSPDWKAQSVRIVATPADDIITALAMATPQESGEFRLANMTPGRFKLQIAGAGASYYIKQVKVGESVVEGDEVEIGGPSSTVTVELAVTKMEISGLARNTKGDGVAGALIGLIPEPRRAYRTKVTSSDKTGQFRIPNVAPGEYLLVSVEGMEPGAVEDEEFLKPYLSKAKKIKVEGAGASGVEVEVLPKRP